MHIPSASIYKEMRSINVGVWIVPTVGEGEVALIIKSPTAGIKALAAGCNISLVFGEKDQTLCLGVRINDTPDRPLFICNTIDSEENFLALAKSLELDAIPTFLFNEMDACLAWCDTSFQKKDMVHINELITRGSTNFSSTVYNKSEILDCFFNSTDNSNDTKKMSYFEVDTTPDSWNLNHIYAYSESAHHSISLEGQTEGDFFEKSIWASLEAMFSKSIYTSPQVKTGNTYRELTDILALNNDAAFLIEAKDQSVFKTDLNRQQQRKTSGVIKQTKKAINQLIGASNSLKKKLRPVVQGENQPIHINLESPFHCIVLITELVHDGDWSDITKQLIKAAHDTGDFYHLLDLDELITLLKLAQGNAEKFDEALQQRALYFAKVQSVHIRVSPN